MSLNIENLKFTIFGSGHDYTLANSGKGEVRWFSHPFMAKGSRAYAGMYYFQVPNEQGEMFDAVKDDIAHCTFTPALGDTFDTVGEQEIRVDYYREYPHDEDTLVVEKHLKQTITVVDHGAVASSYYNNIIYADGYCYVNPASDYVSRNNGWWLSGSFKKISSLPWGTDSISNISNNLEDASEMGFADFSQMTSFKELFKGKNKLTNIQNFDQIDVSHIRNVQDMFYGCDSLVDITPLKTWKLQNCSNFEGFLGATGIVNTDGLQNIDFSSAYSTKEFFYYCLSLTDLNGISGWDMTPIEDTVSMFEGCNSLTDLSPIGGWDMSHIVNVTRMFRGFIDTDRCPILLSLDGLEDWDVSNVRFFTKMFEFNYWLDDISALASWNVSNGLDFEEMFNGIAVPNLTAISGWDMSNSTNIHMMFGGSTKYYSDRIDKYIVWVDGQYGSERYLDYQGNQYMYYDVTPPNTEIIIEDASAVAGWNVPNGSDAFAVNPDYPDLQSWTNIPAWN